MILQFYLSRFFVARFAFCLAALAALLQVLDLLDNATDAMQRGGMAGILTYAALRLPSTINQVVPVSVLLGALMTFTSLAQNNEIVAIRSSGVTLRRIVASLLPITAVIGLLHFALGDQIAPRTERSFQDWWAVTARPSEEGGSGERLWIHDRKAIVSVQRVADGGRLLEGVRIFDRDDAGNLIAQVTAPSAEYGSTGWTLAAGHRTTISKAGQTSDAGFDRLGWPTNLTPRNFADLAAPTEALTLRRLLDIVAGRWAASGSESYYRTRLQRKFALPTGSLVMLVIAAPAAAGLRRHGNLSRGLGLGLVAGFLFLITDGLLLAAGQGGLLSPALAAWAPALLFASLGGAILLHLEEKG